MAINFPINLPATTGIKRIEFSFLSAVAITRSPFTLNQQVQNFPGQMWGVEVSTPRMSLEQAGRWQSFLLKLNGQQGTFKLGDPTKTEPRGSALGIPLVRGAGQSGQELVTDGWDPSEAGLLLEGDHIELTGNRLHQVLNDVNSDVSGIATIDIWPALRTAPADNLALILVNPQGVFRLADNSENVQNVDQTRTVSLKFSGVEAI